MANPCKVCVHPERQDIDFAMSQPSAAISVISQDFGIEANILRRHRDKHFKADLPSVLRTKTDPITLFADLELVKNKALNFIERAEVDVRIVTWTCVKCGEEQSKTESGNLKVGLQALREMRETVVAMLDQSAKLGTLEPNSRQSNRAIAIVLEALEPFPEAKAAVLQKLESLR